MPLSIGLNPILYEVGANGVPTAQYVDSLRWRMDSYEHTIAALFGFESCSIRYAATKDEALAALQAMLMRSLVVYGPDAEVVWEGYCNRVEAQIGQETRSLSLDPTATRVRCRYTTVNDVAGTTSLLSDTAAVARYGARDYILNLPKTTAATALSFATQELARRKSPRKQSSSRIATGDMGEIAITLGFEGWYGTLGAVVTSRTDTSSEDAGLQVRALLGSVSPGIGAINAFISTATHEIPATGVSQPKKIAPDTTYRAAIEQRLRVGNSSNQRLVWGVYEGRVFKVAAWAGATPSVITYRRDIREGVVYNAAYGTIAPWNVRPNAMYQTVDLLDPTALASADSGAADFVERVRFRAAGDAIELELEPEESDSVDALLARLE